MSITNSKPLPVSGSNAAIFSWNAILLNVFVSPSICDLRVSSSSVSRCFVMSTIFPTAMYGWEPSYRYRHVNENQRYSPDNTRARQVMVRSSFGGAGFSNAIRTRL